MWEISQKLACALAIIVPCHIFEENTLPAGFYYMNNVGFGSKEPMVYPQEPLRKHGYQSGGGNRYCPADIFRLRNIEASTVTLETTHWLIWKLY